MQVIPDTEPVLKAAKGKVADARAQQILHTLRSTKADRLPEVIAAFRRNQMPPAELALAESLVGIPQQEPKDTAKAPTKG